MTDISPSAVADRLAITDQLYRYCRSVDRLDVPLGHAVFQADATADFGAIYTGSGRGWIDFICTEHTKYLHHSHQVTNVLITLDGDRAGSEAYVVAILSRDIGGSRVEQRHFCARYVDRWSRRDGIWRIDARECVIDFASIGEVVPLGEHERARRDRADPSYAVLGEMR